MTLDQTNALLESASAVLVWANVLRIRRDKSSAGINLATSAYFCLLGAWFVAYYILLNQPYSAWTQSVFVLGNVTWLAHALWYKR